MNWEQSDGHWQRLKISLKARWSKLTEADLADLADLPDRRQKLLEGLREKYGWSLTQAEGELRDWERHQEPIEPSGHP